MVIGSRSFLYSGLIEIPTKKQKNRLSDNDSDNNRWLQGITLGLIISALYMEHLVKERTHAFGDAITHGDVMALAPGQAY